MQKLKLGPDGWSVVKARKKPKLPFEDAYVDAVTKPLRRSHKNQLDRLTAKERARSLVTTAPFTPAQLVKLLADVQRLLQAHARAAVALHERKHGV